MSNEELKKKIVEVLFPVIKSGNISCNEENACKRCWFPCEIERTAGRLADALIAAGIGDTKAAVREFAGVLRDKIFREHSLGTKGYIVGFKEMKERALADVDALVKDVCGDESNDDRLR